MSPRRAQNDPLCIFHKDEFDDDHRTQISGSGAVARIGGCYGARLLFQSLDDQSADYGRGAAPEYYGAQARRSFNIVRLHRRHSDQRIMSPVVTHVSL